MTETLLVLRAKEYRHAETEAEGLMKILHTLQATESAPQAISAAGRQLELAMQQVDRTRADLDELLVQDDQAGGYLIPSDMVKEFEKWAQRRPKYRRVWRPRVSCWRIEDEGHKELGLNFYWNALVVRLLWCEVAIQWRQVEEVRT